MSETLLRQILDEVKLTKTDIREMKLRLTGIEERQSRMEERQTVLEQGQSELFQLTRAIEGNLHETRAEVVRLGERMDRLEGTVTRIADLQEDTTFVLKELSYRTNRHESEIRELRRAK
ncbi:hypothetical protein GTO91_10750 [Heliobacterium undosum]|uniref:Uncharacterized protein n=1 Tax=Heliomicrobium undosum TaxID=121734 RepID=A0A845L118_9FIRM|nr:hypothetical protein [Heliomicrobium undosum]MZP30187.1 hypothetical protein [Heliomicrobium undosum]